MTDVVWMRLNVITDGSKYPEYFLFGINGITRFRATDDDKGTMLMNVAGNVVAVVKETEDTIFNFIAKVRGTSGKQGKKTARSRKTSKR